MPRTEMKTASEPHQSVLSPWLQAVILAVSVMLVVSHRPDALLNPQFWAEDGTLWYAQAHNLGWWNVFFQPESGYLCVLTRITAGLAQLVPLAAAPLLFNLVAIFFQVLPVNFFLSSRFASLARLRDRLLLSFLYLALPNSFGVNANITNALWHLALLACLVILASPACSLLWRCFDVGTLVLSSLTGPFAIMLWPLAAVAWGWKRRSRWTAALLALLTAGALLQTVVYLRTGSTARIQGSLGASPLLLAKILATQVFGAALMGKNTLPYRHSYTLHAVLIAIAGIAVFLYALWKARWELKLFIVFAGVVLTAALSNPMAPPPKWQALLTAWGERYWFVPMLAFVAALVWMVGSDRPRNVRMIASTALLLMSIGVVRDWRHLRFVDLHFDDYARQYSDLPRGSSLTVPLNPPGWSMTLTKR
jgi:hypothetical protein